MNWEEQRKEFDDTVAELKTLLFEKGKEYASTDDALANFSRASVLGVTPQQKLGVFLDKHMSAVYSYIRNGETYSNETIEGRINDATNYLFLLRCLIKQSRKEKSSHEG